MANKLSALTETEISKLKSEYCSSGYIYQVSLEQLGRQFLADVFGLNSGENFNKIRKLYIEDMKLADDEVSDDDYTFYTKVTEDFLYIDREPRQTLIQTFFTASQHLADIEIRITTIKNELDQINASKNPTDIQSKAAVPSYYLDHNKQARENLIDFLAHKIHPYVLKKCNKFERRDFEFMDIPYHYSWNPQMYDVRYPTMVANKFKFTNKETYLNIEKLYEDDKGKFQEFLTTYIEDNEVFVSISSALSRNHIINKRAETIDEALRARDEGKKVVFASICVMIIEGIFHDICILLGVPEDKILGAGFQAKLNYLQERMDLDFHYEYYSFKFRLLRNKIAHGLMDAKEAKEVSDLLLLDLADVIDLADSMKIPMRQKLFFIDRSSSSNEPEPTRFNYIAGYLFMNDVKIDDFYSIQSKEAKILETLKSKKFWEHLRSLLNNSNLEERSLGQAILDCLKSLRDPELDPLCINELKILVKKDVPK